LGEKKVEILPLVRNTVF